MTNGSMCELSDDACSLLYRPGQLVGGELEHDCSVERGITYYLEAVMVLAPFCKKPVDIKLRGVTNNTTGINLTLCVYAESLTEQFKFQTFDFGNFLAM